MKENNKIFDDLKTIFNNNGFRLYMIGSSSRDYLLNREITDYDFVTDATPDESYLFLKQFVSNMNFSKYGIIQIKYLNYKIDIATFRKEEDYEDFRHPMKVTLIKDLNIDSKRRDFTINAIYIDESYNIIDPQNGLDDLKNGIIRMIGDPDKRIKEDPLRIIRANRFAKKYNFKIDEELQESLKNNEVLLGFLNPEKVKAEKNKE